MDAISLPRRCTLLRSAALPLILAFTSSSFGAVGVTPGTPSVSATGGASYEIPLTLPPGTNGLTPSLSLKYDHRQVNGLLGVGWAIAGPSAIKRCNRTIAQDAAASGATLAVSDGYCLDGSRLRLVDGTYGTAGSKYQTEIETFSLATAQGVAGAGPASWEVRGRNGLIYEYGNSADSRIETINSTSARVWALNKIRDRSGNYIEFVYIEDTTNGSYRPHKIRYTGHSTLGTSPATEVEFVYESVNRPDPIYRFRFGVGTTLDGQMHEVKRLDRINVVHLAGPTTVRTYELEYEPAGGAGGRSRLDYIQECRGMDCFQATDFSWINGTPSWASTSTSTGVSASTEAFIGDISGDGRDDVVWSSSTTSGGGHWYYMLGTDTGPGSATSSGLVNWNYTGSQAIEWNGDSLMDLLVPCSGGSTWCVLQSTGSGFTSINTGTPTTGWTTNKVLAIDADGDGRDDLLRIINGRSMGIRLHGASGFGAETTAWTSPGFDQITGDFAWIRSMRFRSLKRNWDFDGDSREDFFLNMLYDEGPGGGSSNYVGTFFGNGASLTTGAKVGTTILPTLAGDGNGDGLTDLYFFTASTSYYRMSRGRNFTPNIAGPPVTGLITQGAVLLDYDGDGLDDLVVPKNSPNSWFLARSTGNGIATLADLGFSATSWSGQRAADANGDGLGDMVAIHAFRLHNGVYPDLLDRMTDGFGMYVDFNYAPLTAGGSTYTKGSGATFPTIDYQGPLYVVSSLTTTDGIAGTYSTTLTYEQARYHYQGRGFLGFGKFKVTDSRNDIRTEHTFLQDPAQFQVLGALSVLQVKQGSGTLIGETTNTWNYHAYVPGPQERRFPFIATQVVKRYEAGGAYNGSLLTTTTTTNSVDSTSGIVHDSTSTTVEAVTANGAQPSTSYTNRVYHPTAQLLNDTTGNWCIGRPGQTQLINSHTEYGGASSTRTMNRVWDTSLCRVTQEVLEPDSTQWKAARDLVYDDWGDVESDAITGIGMAARTTTADWGSTGRFLISVTNPLSQLTQIGWDATIGVPTSHTDPNNLVTSWQYDGFGRRTREDRPDGTASTWSYNDCATYGCLNSNNKMIVIATDLHTGDGYVNDLWLYLDRFNRPIAASARMLFGSDNRIDREYDALGRVHRQSAPCWLATCTQYWTTFTYDVLNRATQIARPTSDSDPTLASTTRYFEGLEIRVVDPLTKQSTKIVNALGGLAQSVDHDGHYQTFDIDAFGNVVRVTDSSGNTLQSIAYNVRGMKTAHTDMDMGGWSFTPNALGEMVSMTDAKSQNTTFAYDALGRLTSRTESEGLSTWTWGTSAAAKNIGQLASQAGPGYSESYAYDAYGRPQTTTIVSDATYQVDYAYNALGLLHTLTYPTSTSSYRLKLQYDYQNGHLLRVRDFNAPTSIFWQALATDPRGNVLDETLGNGLQTTRGFDLVTGLIDSIQTGPGGGASVQNLSYVWNKVGNLTQRQDVRQTLTEIFHYDNLHRLDYSTLNGATNIDLSYDALGNITSKSDVGSYSYHATKKHAVTAAGSHSFTYDANGNAITRDGHAITWYSYNLPTTINAPSSNSSQFFYAPHRSRWKQVANDGGTTETTIYIGGLIEKVTRGGTTSWKHYIAGGTGAVAVYTRKSDATNAVHYLTRDHLGNVDSVTDASGAIEVRLSFASFGQRRNESGWSGALPSGDLTQITATTRRGFTFHEMLDSVGLTHMNGRVYDPVVGRFLSADPLIQAPGHTQSFNRYSYVWNNPLSFVDPTGFEIDPKHLCIEMCAPTTSPFSDTIRVGGDGYTVTVTPLPPPGAPQGSGGLGGSDSTGGLMGYGGIVSGTTRSPGTGGSSGGGGRGSGSGNGSGGPSGSSGGGHTSTLDYQGTWGDFTVGLVSGAADDTIRLVILAGAFHQLTHGNFIGGLTGLTEGWSAQVFGPPGTNRGEYGYELGPLLSAAIGGAAGAARGLAARGGAGASDAFHYTFSRALASIRSQGLRPGSYATPNGALSPLQAHIDLALPANRGLPDALMRIDLAGLRRAGYQIPEATQVGRSFGMPGGGMEMQFSYPIPPQFITVLP